MKHVKSFFCKPVNLFYLISLTGIVGFFVCACFSRRGTTLFDWLIMGGNSDFFMSDYSRHVGYAAKLKKTYFLSVDSCFPPFSYLLFHFLYAINPVTTKMSMWYNHALNIKYEPLIYTMWTALQAVLMAYLVRKETRLSVGRTVTLTFLLLLSMPFLAGAIERGNPVFLTALMLCAALWLKDRKTAWQRELALILIACAAGFKITPCVMGVLYIKEKRWGEACRLMIYGALIFFLPFIFTGGIKSFERFLYVLSRHELTQTVMWTSFPGFVRWWALRLFGHESLLTERIIKAAFVVVMLLSAFLTKYRWKTVLYLSMIMAYAHALSFRYYTVYMVLPLLCLIAETCKKRKNNIDTYIYHFLFACVFTIPIWGIGDDPEHWVCGAAYLLCLRAIATDVQEWRAKRKDGQL